MRFHLEPTPRRRRIGKGAAIAAALWGVLFLATVALGLPGLLPPCLLKQVTGVPCPLCGGTRAVERLVHADLPEAVATNPLVLALLLGGFVWLGLRVVLGRRPTLEASPTERRWLWVGVVALVLLSWAYVIAFVG